MKWTMVFRAGIPAFIGKAVFFRSPVPFLSLVCQEGTRFSGRTVLTGNPFLSGKTIARFSPVRRAGISAVPDRKGNSDIGMHFIQNEL